MRGKGNALFSDFSVECARRQKWPKMAAHAQNGRYAPYVSRGLFGSRGPPVHGRNPENKSLILLTCHTEPHGAAARIRGGMGLLLPMNGTAFAKGVALFCVCVRRMCSFASVPDKYRSRNFVQCAFRHRSE